MTGNTPADDLSSLGRVLRYYHVRGCESRFFQYLDQVLELDACLGCLYLHLYLLTHRCLSRHEVILNGS